MCEPGGTSEALGSVKANVGHSEPAAGTLASAGSAKRLKSAVPLSCLQAVADGVLNLGERLAAGRERGEALTIQMQWER